MFEVVIVHRVEEAVGGQGLRAIINNAGVIVQRPTLSRSPYTAANSPLPAKAAAKQKLGPADAVAKSIVAAVEARKPKRRYMAGSGVAIFAVLAHLPTGVRERMIKTVFGTDLRRRSCGDV